MPDRKSEVFEQIPGIDDMIKRLGALPNQADRALRQAGKEASAAGYREGKKVLASHGLSEGTVVGYRRWFSTVGPDGMVHLWLGENPLRRAGDFVDMPSGRRRRGDVEFPPGAADDIQRRVTPLVHEVFQNTAEREIPKQIARG